MRIGIGYDVHKLVEGRELIIGGIKIPYHKGLLGHSDADVLTHAIIDALLGAAALGDIGKIFPDTSKVYKDIDSQLLLKRVASMLKASNYTIGNIDATVVCEQPKLKKYIPNMIKGLSKTLQVEQTTINIKATTSEGLGFEGEGLGISAQAIALLNHSSSISCCN